MRRNSLPLLGLLLLSACASAGPSDRSDDGDSGAVRDTGSDDTGALEDSNSPLDTADEPDGSDDAASLDDATDGSGSGDTAADTDDALDDTTADGLDDAADTLDEAVADTLDDAADTAADATDTTPPAVVWRHATTTDGPTLDYASNLDLATATALAERAVASLGFASGDPAAPAASDHLVVTRHLVAWLDATGFYGKLQGLWTLDGTASPTFLLRDLDDRPVNFLVVGENGDGRWPAGYVGSEHLEFPNRTPEPGDNPACAAGDWCNQFGLAEATPITDADIPWWSACNGSNPAYTQRFAPLVVNDDGPLELVWDGRLVKRADGDGTYDGDNCGADWLFPDGIRRPVYLQTGFRIAVDAPSLERVARFRNPSTNPAFDGPMSLIGGFVLTSWPNPHPLKQLHRWLRPETTAFADPISGLTYLPATWTRQYDLPASGDKVFAWLGQPLSLSSSDRYLGGASVRMSHDSGVDDNDTGACLCRVHGGLELGGGILHTGASLPVAPGAWSPWAIRTLTFPNEGAARRIDYAVSALGHSVGRADGDTWVADVANDTEGHLLFGPYATDWGGGTLRAGVELAVDVADARTETIVRLDLYDADAGQVVAERDVPRAAFRAGGVPQWLTLDADLAGREGRRMEFRVWFSRRAAVRAYRTAVLAQP